MSAILRSFCAAAALALVSTAADAQSKGEWHFGLGITGVQPKSDNGDFTVGMLPFELDIGDGTAISLTAEYFVADNIGIEFLASTPFNHDVNTPGSNIGDFDLIPPTLSVNYHFQTGTQWKPYVGAGVTYAIITDEFPSGLSIENAWGFGVQAGIDYKVSDKGALRLNVRYIDLEADFTLGPTTRGTAEVDPLVITAAYVFQF